MKLSCLPVSLFGDISSGKISLKEWAEFGKSQNLDAIDLGIVLLKNHTPVYIDSVRKDLEDVGIGIGMITDYPDFTHPNAMQREREYLYFTRDIALAAQVGAKFLRVTPGQNHPEISREDGVRNAVEYIKRSADVADKMGIKLVFENHSKPGAWKYADFGYNPDVFLEIAKQLKDTSVGINFDTANIIAYGADPIPVLREVVDQVVTVHAADTSMKGELKPPVVGTGLVPFKEIFSILKAHGFDNYICIEEWSNTGFDGIAKSIANIRELWASA